MRKLPARLARALTALMAVLGVVLLHAQESDTSDVVDRGKMVVEGIAGPLRETLVEVWKDFLGRVPFIVAGMLVVLLTWAAAALVRRSVRRVLARSDLRHSLQALLVRFAMIGVWVLGLLLAAMVVFPDLTPSNALGAMGILSIAVGFAFRDIFENFFAGILLLWHFPFEPGDYIECEGICGRVEEVTIRMTEILVPNGELIVVPNAFLFKNPVHVLTHRPSRRVEIMAGVAYGEKVPEAVEVIRRAVEACRTVDDSHPVEVFPHGFGSSSIDIEVAWWTDPTPLGIRRSRGEVVTAIKGALDESGIEIPFPYRTLTFKEPLDIRQREEGGDNDGD